MAARRRHVRRPTRSKVYRRGRVSRRRLQPSFQGVVPQSLHTRFSAVGKRRRTAPFSATGSRSAFGGSATTTRFKRKRTAPVSAMQELTKSTKRVRIQKYSMARVVDTSVNHYVSRFQLLSNFDTNVGAEWISNREQSGGSIVMPMVIFDLGSQLQPSLALPGPPALSIPYWLTTSPTAPLGVFHIPGQNADGTTSGNVTFQQENSDAALPFRTNVTRGVLDWVSLRLNLYGQRKRTTKFVVTIFQITDDEVDPINGDSSNVDRKALFQYLERPFIFSNLQQDWKGKRTGMKVIKEFTYNVAPMTSIDLNTTTGNIHEANIKVQINKKMDYMYTKANNPTAILGHTQLDGLDYNDTTSVNSLHQSPMPKQNVFVAVRAFAPIRTYYEEGGPQANDSPSFDVIVRRGFTFPT